MNGRSVLRTIGLSSGVICLALPPFAAPGLSSLPQAKLPMGIQMRSARPTPSTTAAAITQATAAIMAGIVAAHRAFQRSARHAWRFQRRHKRREQLCFLGLQAIETAWRSAGANVRITLDSILIVESNWAAAPMERFSSKETSVISLEDNYNIIKLTFRTVSRLDRYQRYAQPELGLRAVVQV